ncbi:MAG: class II fructose-bisphosphate aldolase [Firmicutes bacterium]|nr:class II fructose-bisphosphate aldolase [Bacillota bacterium]
MLVSMKQILDRANAANYAVLAPDIFSEIDARAFIEAAEDMNAPLILGVAYPTTNDLSFLGRITVMLAQQSRVPIAINLDHGADIVQVAEAVRGGFTSVMIDCSMLAYEENVARVKEVVDMVHPLGISVEAEIGHVGSGEDYEAGKGLTDPEEALRFIKETGIDACAVSIGTAHGAYKGTPHLDFERLEKIKAMTQFPLVLHGSSGTGEENIRRACRSGINKVNVCNDLLKAAYTKISGTELVGNQVYDFWPIIADTLRDSVKQQIDITGSTDKAWNVTGPGLPRGAVTMKE